LFRSNARLQQISRMVVELIVCRYFHVALQVTDFVIIIIITCCNRRLFSFLLVWSFMCVCVCGPGCWDVYFTEINQLIKFCTPSPRGRTDSWPSPCVLMAFGCIATKFGTIIHPWSCFFASVLWHCWFGSRKGIWHVKELGVGLLVVTIWLEHCTSYSSSCHHHLHHP